MSSVGRIKLMEGISVLRVYNFSARKCSIFLAQSLSLILKAVEVWGEKTLLSRYHWGQHFPASELSIWVPNVNINRDKIQTKKLNNVLSQNVNHEKTCKVRNAISIVAGQLMLTAAVCISGAQSKCNRRVNHQHAIRFKFREYS